jgi:hypothetical protein
MPGGAAYAVFLVVIDNDRKQRKKKKNSLPQLETNGNEW